MISDPLCWTGLSPNNFCKNFLKNNLEVSVTKMKNVKLGDTKTKEKRYTPPCHADAYSSWTGEIIGARITSLFEISRVNLFYEKPI